MKRISENAHTYKKKLHYAVPRQAKSTTKIKETMKTPQKATKQSQKILPPPSFGKIQFIVASH